MSDPTHVRIIDALVEGEIGVGERVERFGLTQSAISHQLRGLNNKRLIRTRKLGRNVFNCLDDEHAAELFACGLDLGDDYFTQGKPHPMIDVRERYKRILKEAEDPEVAILLLDFLLGDISSSDPVGDLIEAIRQAQARAAQRGGRLTAAASVCGTD